MSSFDHDRETTGRIHFGLRWLFSLTTLVALSVGIAWSLDLHDLIRPMVAGYLLTLSCFGLGIFACWRRLKRLEARLAARRAELQRELDICRSQMAPAAAQPSDDDNACSAGPHHSAS